MSEIKVGDMVLLVKIDVGSTAWSSGIRTGMIGTVVRPSYLKIYHWIVDFPILEAVHATTDYLRKIEPPEASQFYPSVWVPNVMKPTLITPEEVKEWES
jgi:hypothetical protein